ncbi:MAG: hybrid sensor histidine kinase/response regulator [Rhizobiales bacterium 17-65-6]|nr:MAG: hybrid sensor histidine kinase/response regulator [Rhizobiales bacterium 17-65-6]
MKLAGLSEAVRARPWLSYLLAVMLSALALLVRLAAGDIFAGYPFITFIPVICLVAFLGGFWPGMLAAVLGGLMVAYYLVTPEDGFGLDWPSDYVAMLFYGLTALLIIALTSSLLAALQHRKASDEALQRLNAELEARIAERTSELQQEMTERFVAEAQIRQMQKTEAIGQLTGGIAHDFNNMLAIVIGSLDIARRRLTGAEHEMVHTCIDNALEGAQRAAALTARLLAFSRQQALEPQPLDANKLVGGMSELLRRTLGETIQVETVLAGGLWRAFADPAQLENAIVNLAVNARDAMPDGGRLTIETANSDLDERYARNHAEVTAGQYVLVSVSDTGTGMGPEVIERAFDPFYTTKGVGRGTGLGLSQVFGFVKQSGGHVKIYSEIGQGTTVKLYLPRLVGEPALAGGASKSDGHLPPGRPDITILVVEDEENVRHMSVDALRELGYTVVQAASGNQAMEQLVLQPRIDLLFTDIVMPDMTGRQLAEKAAAARADLKILYTTGYTRNAVVHNGILDHGVAFLPKPFTLDQLARKVDDVLADRGINRP